jgi:hypothetical protein
MTDFFGALELELRAAAERRPRRPIGVARALGALAASLVLLAAVVVVLAVLSGGATDDPGSVVAGPKPDPVGTVIPDGQGSPARPARSTVVATGTVRYSGPWQLETYRGQGLKDPDTGEVYEPAGLRCVTLYLLDPPVMRVPAGAGFCGAQPRTPGFTRAQMSVPSQGRRADGTVVHPRQVLIYGQAPERAEYVLITVPNGLRMRVPVAEGPPGVRGDFYLAAVPPRLGPGARINWLDRDGDEGSRGTRLMPPLTPR